MTQQARWHISCDSVFRMRSAKTVKKKEGQLNLDNHIRRRGPHLPLESKILVASSIEVVCIPSFDLDSKR